MVFFNQGDKVTVLDDSNVPLEWRGVNATVEGFVIDGGGQQKTASLVNE